QELVEDALGRRCLRDQIVEDRARLVLRSRRDLVAFLPSNVQRSRNRLLLLELTSLERPLGRALLHQLADLSANELPPLLGRLGHVRCLPEASALARTSSSAPGLARRLRRTP